MCSHVLLQVGALGEMSLTNITPETERKWCTRPMLFNKKFPCVLCIISSSTKKHIPNCLAAKFQSVWERVCGKWKAQLTCMVWCRDGFLCVVTSSWNSRRTCYTETQEKSTLLWWNSFENVLEHWCLLPEYICKVWPPSCESACEAASQP